MKPTKIYVEAKISRNFQTYTVGLEAELDIPSEQENPEPVIRMVQAKCRKLAKEQVAIDSPSVEKLK